MGRYIYPAIFTYGEGQEIAVAFPDLDVATSGVDDVDARKSAVELLGLTMLGIEEDGEAIPAPTELYAVRMEANERVALIEVNTMPLRFDPES